jgi:DNA-binding Lrp family transcriptional regulator
VLPIDPLDLEILGKLVKDSRKTNIGIAKELSVSEATVRNRIRKMEKIGLIRGYSAKVNFRLMENPVKAYVTVKVRSEHRRKVTRQLARHPRTIAVYKLAGESDIMAVMLFPSTKEYQDFEDRHPTVKGARSVTMQVVISPYKGVVWSGA